MENILNAFHFCIYLMDRRLHYLSNKINPAILLFRLPCVKKKYESKGQNIYEEFNKLYTDKEFSFGIMVAGGILISVIGFILISTFIILSRVLGLYQYVPRIYFFLFAGVSAYICNNYVFKKDKYLLFFEKYETSWTKSEKRKYVLFSFLVIIATISLFFTSLFCC